MDLNCLGVAVITDPDSWHSDAFSGKYGVYIPYNHPT